MSKQRNHNIDVCRGLAMIAVVLGHCGFPFTREIYAFHVPVFFVITGYLYRHRCNNKKELGKQFFKKIERLYVPYVLFSSLFVITLNPAISFNLYPTSEIMNLYTDIAHTSIYHEQNLQEGLVSLLKVFAFSGGTNLSGAMWFLRVMFFASLIFEIEHFFIKNKIHLVAIVNLALFILGCWFSRRGLTLPLGLDVVLTVMIFFSIGEELRILVDYYKLDNADVVKILLFCIISCVLIFVSAKYELVNIGVNQFDSPVILLLSTISGFVFLYSLSSLILRLCISTPFEIIGKHTIAILGWHFLAFKIVSVIIVHYKGIPVQYIASFPVLKDGCWWAYAIAGIIIPMLIVYFYNQTKNVYYAKGFNNNCNI